LILYNTLLNHTSWHVVDVIATYYAYVDESVTIGCFLDAHEITLESRWNTKPKLLFLSSKLPTKSLLVYPTKSYFFVLAYIMPQFVVPAMYLRIIFPSL